VKKVEFEFSHRSKPYTEMKTKVTRLSIVRIDQAWLLFSLLLYISKTQTSLSLKERENRTEQNRTEKKRKEKTNAAWSKKVSQVCNSKICCSLHIEVKNKSKYEFLLYRYSAIFFLVVRSITETTEIKRNCASIFQIRVCRMLFYWHISVFIVRKRKTNFLLFLSGQFYEYRFFFSIIIDWGYQATCK